MFAQDPVPAVKSDAAQPQAAEGKKPAPQLTLEGAVREKLIAISKEQGLKWFWLTSNIERLLKDPDLKPLVGSDVEIFANKAGSAVFKFKSEEGGQKYIVLSETRETIRRLLNFDRTEIEIGQGEGNNEQKLRRFNNVKAFVKELLRSPVFDTYDVPMTSSKPVVVTFRDEGAPANVSLRNDQLETEPFTMEVKKYWPTEFNEFKRGITPK